ncbi:MAG: CopG family ribbon-helix-helix protein [Lactobacillales bacterium]|jgi:predicted transcriptional regulator|nr:CopG family ribbon-helix-helix protein [Lactobacillales bacterium]
MNTLSFRTEETTKKKLDILAAQQNRDRSFIINQAIEYFIGLNEWQTQHIKQGLEQANRGEFADDKAVKSVFAKWKK